MVAIVPADVVGIYNHVWNHQRQTAVLGGGLIMCATRPNGYAADFKLMRQQTAAVGSEAIWTVGFSLTGRERWHSPRLGHKLWDGEVLVCDYHPMASRGGWEAREYQDYVRAGTFKIEKIKGDLTAFQKDWTMLLMFGHEWRPETA